MFEFKEIARENEFNPLTIRDDTPFTQGPIYGQWQEMAGRKVRRFEIKQGEKILGFFQLIKYELFTSRSFSGGGPFSKNMLYIPHAPLLRQDYEGQAEFLKAFHEKLIEIGKEENAVFVRFDFFLPSRSFSKGGADLSKYFKKVPAHAYHSSYFQPKYEWVIDLKKTEEELTSEMHPKTRYNIRLAEKKGVKIEIIKDDFVPLRGISRREKKYFDIFYELLNQTAKRDNFNLHPKDYYRNIFQTLDSGNAFLVVAEYEGKTLLINLVLLYGETAYFIFGGSSGEFKNLMFSHLAQWEAIKEAKNRGFGVYNFGGVQGNDRNYKNYEGVSVFKKRFGGEIYQHSDSYDIILKPFWYYLYNLRKWVLNLPLRGITRRVKNKKLDESKI